MQNEQRSQPAGAPAAPEVEHAHVEHAHRDSDVVQAALRLHLKHLHAVEAAHADAEESLRSTGPASPAAAERAAAHHVRREAIGQRRGFLEQLAGFPASGLAALTAEDMRSLRIPAGVGAPALRGPLPPHGGHLDEPSEDSSAPAQDYLFPEDDPEYAADAVWELPSTESWEPEQPDQTAPDQTAPDQTEQQDHGEQHDRSAQHDHAEAAAPSGKSYLPESRPDFRDLVSGRAEVPESSPKTRRTWMGLRRKGQPKR